LRASLATTRDDRDDISIDFTVATIAVDVTWSTSTIRFVVRDAPTRIHSADAREARSSHADGCVAAGIPAASPARQFSSQT
jgi:hypothetical protein